MRGRLLLEQPTRRELLLQRGSGHFKKDCYHEFKQSSRPISVHAPCNSWAAYADSLLGPQVWSSGESLSIPSFNMSLSRQTHQAHTRLISVDDTRRQRSFASRPRYYSSSTHTPSNGAKEQTPGANQQGSPSSGRNTETDPFKGQRPRRRRSRLYRFGRGFLVVGLIGTVAWEYDRRYNAAAVIRSLRAGWMGLVTTIDYKWNFNPARSSQIDALHERVAHRLHAMVVANQGLWIKFGQAIGLQAALLPKPYREAFANIFDNAPSVPFEEVRQVFKEDFGVDSPLDIFKTFDEEPIASASIAQVHLATILRPGPDGRPREQRVAVKVQKPEIEKQMEWDLWSYRTLLWLTEKLFNIPMYFVAEYVSEQMRKEVDFSHEAGNAERCRAFLENTPELRDKVYVPKVYKDVAGGSRTLVMEYIEGACRITDKEAIERMGFNPKETMDAAIAVFSAMAFSWGFVHCDPHPGNVLVRRNPRDPKKPQVVLLDHGLYITLSEKFRKEYCTLWRSLFTLDVSSIERIAKEWGIALDPNMFASAILLRPFKVTEREKKPQGDAASTEPPQTEYEQQQALKERIIHMLENEKLVPRELIFLSRGHRMFQSNNQVIGSPSPRINITAKWAVKGYEKDMTTDQARSLWNVGLRDWLRDRLQVIVFRSALFALDLSFWSARLKQWWYKGTEKGNRGWEDQLQEQMGKMAHDEFGIDLDDDVFVG